MIERIAVRGDTLRFQVPNVIGGSSVPTTGWTPSLEIRKHPADATPMGALAGNDGISSTGSAWDIELSEALTRVLSEPGRPSFLHYQLRLSGNEDTVTVETGVIRILRDVTRMNDGFQDAVGLSADLGTY